MPYTPPSIFHNPLTLEEGRAVWKDIRETGCTHGHEIGATLQELRRLGEPTGSPTAKRLSVILLRHMRSEYHRQYVKGGTVYVTFNQVDEFVGEVKREKDRIAAGHPAAIPIVRLTCSARLNQSHMRTVSVIGTAVMVGTASTGPQIIRLENHCGEEFARQEDHTATDEAGKVLGELQKKLMAMGFDVRAGYYEPDGQANIQ